MLLLLSAPPAAAEPAQGVTLRADLRTEYLAGSPLLVTIEARNDTAAPITLPDLSVRHDLVRFELRTPSGEMQTRRTLVENPAEKVWSIPPRGKREVLLEIPSASTLKPGDYEIAVHFTLGDTEKALEPQTIRLARPAPAAADLEVGSLPFERAGDWTPWLHRSGDAYDLYLHRTPVTDPLGTESEDYLTRLTAGSSPPSLSASRSADLSNRYVVWMEDERTIGLARLQGHRLRAAPRSIASPWPKVSLAARGATAADGRLYQPLWISAPRGPSGEIRVLSADENGSTSYRKLGRYEQPPEQLRTIVTDAGDALFLLVQRGHLDLYTVQSGDERAESEGLPVPGQRLRSADPAATVQDVRFTLLPASEAYAGGLAILGLFAVEGGLQPRWMGLSGAAIKTGATIPVPEGSTLVDFSPNGMASPGLLLQLSNKTLRYQEGGAYQSLGTLEDVVALDRSDGVPLLRRLDAPVTAIPLKPETPLAP
ncbi:MAG: hypothetical protein P8R54_33200 [Myxococcota bacterium]|nr:hypothetical protein [Myxococcota bacterium]